MSEERNAAAIGGPGGGHANAENIGHGAPGHSPGSMRVAPEIGTFVFDEASEAEIAYAVAKYPEGRQASAVMALLYAAQKQMGRQTGSAWVPRVAMDVIAARLGMAPIRVYEVATFYLMYNTRPIGSYHLQVCTTTPCWLRGSDAIVETCRKVGGVAGFGETSPDGMFTMTEVECLGACVNAPILQVDDDYYEDLDAERCASLLEALRRGERPKPGPTIDRLNSAAEGGRTTLLGEQTRAREPSDEVNA
jgi:NADH-quinone oxidoreductase subunit E